MKVPSDMLVDALTKLSEPNKSDMETIYDPSEEDRIG